MSEEFIRVVPFNDMLWSVFMIALQNPHFPNVKNIYYSVYNLTTDEFYYYNGCSTVHTLDKYNAIKRVFETEMTHIMLAAGKFVIQIGDYSVVFSSDVPDIISFPHGYEQHKNALESTLVFK